MPRSLAGTKGLPISIILLGLVGFMITGDVRPPAAAGVGSPQIVDLTIVQDQREYQVSFRLDMQFEPELLEEIDSGLETTLDYRIEVLRQRRFWLDERVARIRVQPSVKYDSLSRQYHLMMKVDGDLQESSTTDKQGDMKRWLTEVHAIGLGPVTDFVPPEDFIVRVKSDLGPRFVLLFIPWGRDTRWARVPLNPARVSSHEPGK